MKPYFEDTVSGIRLFHGDSREVLPEFQRAGERFGCMLTDPVWPGASVKLTGHDRPVELFREVAELAPPLVERLVVQLGRDTDPRMLAGIPMSFPFICACWLRYIPATRKKRFLNGGELAYVFGTLDMKKAPGFLIPSDPIAETFSDLRQDEPMAVSSPGRRRPNGLHPCPRRIEHVRWLVRWFGGESVVDPFAGSGTTLVAARDFGIPCTGVEIEEAFCEDAALRLQQKTLFKVPERPKKTRVWT